MDSFAIADPARRVWRWVWFSCPDKDAIEDRLDEVGGLGWEKVPHPESDELTGHDEVFKMGRMITSGSIDCIWCPGPVYLLAWASNVVSVGNDCPVSPKGSKISSRCRSDAH